MFRYVNIPENVPEYLPVKLRKGAVSSPTGNLLVSREHRLIHAYIKKNDSTLAVLRQNKGTTGFPDLCNQGGRVGPELRKRSDIADKIDSIHTVLSQQS